MSKAAELAALIGSQTALSNRNLIINGAMQVAQRGTSATVGPNGTGEGYTTVDRWENPLNGSVVSTFSQSTDAPSGFANSAKIEITTADTSLDAAEFWFFRTALEGQDVQLLGKGTSGAKSLTLSFWVKSNKTGTYTVEVKDSDNDRSASRAYTVNSSNTWEHKTLTYGADTTGAFDDDNAASLLIQFWLVSGSQYNSGTFTDGVFEAEVNANRVHSSQVNLGDTVGNEWYITGIQLEVGEQATPFEHRSFADELLRCQRYYEQTGAGGPAKANSSTEFWIGNSFRVVKRVDPTASVVDPNSYVRVYEFGVGDRNSDSTPAISGTVANPSGAIIRVGTFSGISAGDTGILGGKDGDSSANVFAFDAEL